MKQRKKRFWADVIGRPKINFFAFRRGTPWNLIEETIRFKITVETTGIRIVDRPYSYDCILKYNSIRLHNRRASTVPEPSRIAFAGVYGDNDKTVDSAVYVKFFNYARDTPWV